MSRGWHHAFCREKEIVIRSSVVFVVVIAAVGKGQRANLLLRVLKQVEEDSIQEH